VIPSFSAGLNRLFTLTRKKSVSRNSDRARFHFPLTSAGRPGQTSRLLPVGVVNTGASMKHGLAWNVKGVGPAARESAREAARRAGLSLGEWLNSVIIDSAADEGVRPPSHDGDDDSWDRDTDDGIASLHRRLDEIAQRLDHLAKPVPVPRPTPVGDDVAAAIRSLEARLVAASRPEPRPDPSAQRLNETIARVNERLDHLVSEGRAASTEIERRVAAVDTALAGLNQIKAPPTVPADAWSSGLDRAVAEITARQRSLDAPPPPAPDLSGLERQLKTLTTELAQLRQPGAFAELAAELRRELAEIGRTLQEAVPRRAVEAIEAELRRLGERIDGSRQRGADSAALAAVERHFAELREALRGLTPAESLAGFDAAIRGLAAKIDQLAADGSDPSALRPLESAVADLRRLLGGVASGEALATLAKDVRDLAEKVDRLAAAPRGGAEIVSSLEQRIESLAAALENRADSGREAPPQLESLLNKLSEQLQHTPLRDSDQVALGHLENQIVRLAEKLDASASRLGQLESVERVMADLMVRLEESRRTAIEAAERAARAAAREVVGSDSAELDTIRQSVGDLRQIQAASERRTQDTLEAVHDTLERLVDRLAMIETEMRGDGRRPGASAPAVSAPAAPPPAAPPPVAPPLAPSAEPASPAGPPRGNRPAPPVSAPAPLSGPPRRPIDPDLPGDTPLEPGAALGRPRPVASAAERIAASEAALGPAKPAPEPSSRANFIAAARRAAQAAAEAQDADADEDKGSGALGALGGLFRRRKALLMSVAAALLMAAGAHAVLTVLSDEHLPLATAPLDPAPVSDVAAARPEPAANVQTAASAPVLTADPLTAGAPSAGLVGTAALPIAQPLPVVPAQLGTGSEVTGTVRAPANATAAVSPEGTGSEIDPATLPATLPAGLRTAALAGDAAAQYEIGVRYAEGRGLPQSLEQAAQWFGRAAEAGLAPALYRLGSLYEKGQGVPKDLDRARRHYQGAADRGNAKAMHNLAVLYAEGIDGKPDYASASQWFRKAAQHGVADSQYNLGILYARGIGVEQNLSESYKWFALAAQQGDQDAGKKRDDVAARLDAQSLVAARLAVQTWTAEPQPAAATEVQPPAGGWERAAAPAKAKPSRKVGAS